MQRVGDSTSTANGAGEFTQGQPGSGIDATIITVPWLNAVQRELIHLILGAGIALDPTDDSQVLKAIRAIQAAANTWANLAGKPTTVAGFGLTDAFTKTETSNAIQHAVADLVGSSPEALNQLNELADALGNDPNFATTVMNALAGKAAKATTLAGYGIGDSYTRTEIDSKVSELSSMVDVLKKLPIQGAHKGLRISTTGLSSIVTVQAEQVITKDSAGNASRRSQLAAAVNLSVTGVNGLDSGVLASSSFYSLWAITNGSSDACVAALCPVISGSTTTGSTSVTGLPSTAAMRAGMQFSSGAFPGGTSIASVDSPTQITASAPALSTVASASLRFVYDPVLPAGYTGKARIGMCLTASNGLPYAYTQIAASLRFDPVAGSNTLNYLVAASGAANPAVSVSLANLVPPTARKAYLVAGTTSGYIGFSPDGAFTSTPGNGYLAPAQLNGFPFAGGYNASGPVPTTQGELILRRMSFLYDASGAASVVQLMGWEDEL